MSEVGRKAARARVRGVRTRTRTPQYGSIIRENSRSLARSLVCRRKVDNVAHVAIVIELPEARGPRRSIERRTRAFVWALRNRVNRVLVPTRSRIPFSRDSVRRRAARG